MRARTISAAAVVLVGLVPAFMGGPVFAIVVTIFCAIGLREYLSLARLVGDRAIWTGFIALPVFTVAAYMGGEEALLGAVALAVGLPLAAIVFRADLGGAFVDWALAAAGALYLGVPPYAAVKTRAMTGGVDRVWVADLARWATPGWPDAPRGLAWLLVIVVATWCGDVGAFLVGRRWGRRLLRPAVSPKKTVEGLAGGSAGAVIASLILAAALGLGIPWWVAALFGLALSIVGAVGDLGESAFKRQASVKDSGAWIPGHGGMLDRIDAMLFTWTAGWFLATLVDHVR